jgi:uncharacterized protein
MLSTAISEMLLRAEILVPAEEREQAFLSSRSMQRANANRTLYRVIMPTADCQLACVYCGQEHSRSKMTAEVQDKILTDVENRLRSGDFSELYVTWFGGEPTLAPELIQSMTESLLRLAGKYAVSYTSKIVTNGAGLKLNLARMLHRELHIRMFEVSVDGPSAIHDLRRPHVSGAGSFRQILNNLSAIAENSELNQCRISLRVNVDKGNCDHVHELIEEIARSPLARRVQMYFAIVIPWAKGREDALLQREMFARSESEWLSHLYLRGIATTLLPKPIATPCLAAQPNSAVISTDGVAHNCTMIPMAPHVVTDSTAPFVALDGSLVIDGKRRQENIFRILAKNI